MSDIEYSPGWFDIFNMSLPELLDLDLYSVSEEDLDPIALRLSSFAEHERVYDVYDAMLLRDSTNPCISYYNLFEKVIIRYMSLGSYDKALNFLNLYLSYDDTDRFAYRNHFILRNIAICYFNLDKAKDGQSIINELISIAPRDYWTYYDLAFEFYNADSTTALEKSVFYLNLGLEQARKWGDDIWIFLFESELSDLQIKML